MILPVTAELLEDTAGLQGLIHRRIRLYMRHTVIRNTIRQWLYQAYGEEVDPQPFDPIPLRPPLPPWPRPHRPLRSNPR